MTMTFSAPRSIAARAAIWPTAPAPHTATTSPGLTPPRSAPIHPVAAESEVKEGTMKPAEVAGRIATMRERVPTEGPRP